MGVGAGQVPMIKVKVCISAEKIPDMVSWLIMRFTRFEGSHVFLIYNDRIFHADGDGVSDIALEPFMSEHHMTKTIDIELPITHDEFMAWYDKHKGIVYGDAQYAGFIMSSMKKYVKNGRRAAICSEFVCWFMHDLVKAPGFDDGEFSSPKSVWALVEQYSKVKNG